MEIKDKKITVVGLGEKTGISLIRYLIKGGAKVFVTEKRKRDEVMRSWNLVSGLDAEFEFGGHSIENVKGSNCVIPCPGVPINSVFIGEIRKLGIEVISELEFSYRMLKPKNLVAVTGTNGKSTTVTMLGDILKADGKDCFVGGNLGNPLCDALLEEKVYDYHVVEVSTFQLEAVRDFAPDIAVLTNVSPNHLDRHGTMEDYVALKSRMFRSQSTEQIAILNKDDEISAEIEGQIRSKKFFVSMKDRNADLYFEKGRIKGRALYGEGVVPLEKFPLAGEHNVYNLMLASYAALKLGCDLQSIGRAMEKFKGLPHRIEYVDEIDGVKYFDDSKSTTVHSTIMAIKSLSGSIVLVAGGQDKGSDFSGLKDALKKSVKAMVLYGDASGKMAGQLSGSTRLEKVHRFDDAIKMAAQIADRGDSVLLSPANASFDQFMDYKERGARFQKIVKDLKI